jgi:hypothetical protein
MATRSDDGGAEEAFGQPDATPAEDLRPPSAFLRLRGLPFTAGEAELSEWLASKGYNATQLCIGRRAGAACAGAPGRPPGSIKLIFLAAAAIQHVPRTGTRT